MDKIEIIEKYKLMVEKIADADMVLVGGGEEVNEDFGYIG